MFNQNNTELKVDSNNKPSNDEANINKYKNILNPYQTSTIQQNEMNYNTIDQLLEKEKQHNKTETWNKLDKMIKIQKLHQYAEKYGKEHNLPNKEVKLLKQFFNDCLEKNKLQKTKEVNYDKDTRVITCIPSLSFNNTNHNFTLRITDTKRVSTLKSLTPKRVKEIKDSEEVSMEN
jgi:hypothetical protein